MGMMLLSMCVIVRGKRGHGDARGIGVEEGGYE
jgi:hypothetical protein